MRTVKTSRGLPNQVVTVLALALPAIIVWLPLNTSTMLVVLGVSIFCWFSLLFLAQVFLPPRILACTDDIGITGISTSMPYEKIDLISLVDCGRTSGWMMGIESKSSGYEKIVLPLSQLSDASGVLWHAKSNADRAGNIVRTTLYGSTADWIASILVALTVVGIVRLLLSMLA